MKLQDLLRLHEARTAKFAIPAELRTSNPMIKNPNPHGRGKEVKFMTAYNAGYGTLGAYDDETRSLFKKAVASHVKRWQKKNGEPVTPTKKVAPKATAKPVAKTGPKTTVKPVAKTTAKVAPKVAPKKVAPKVAPIAKTPVTEKTPRFGYSPKLFDKGRPLKIPTKVPDKPLVQSRSEQIHSKEMRSGVASAQTRQRGPFTPYVYKPIKDRKKNAEFALTYADTIQATVLASPDTQTHTTAVNAGIASVLGPFGIRFGDFKFAQSKRFNGTYSSNNTLTLNRGLFQPDIDVARRTPSSVAADLERQRNEQAIETYTRIGDLDKVRKLKATKRYSLSSSKSLWSEKAASVAIHEAGHALYYHFDLADDWSAALKKNNVSVYDGLAVSTYATTNYSELFAETTAMIHQGEVNDVPDNILAAYKEVVEAGAARYKKKMATHKAYDPGTDIPLIKTNLRRLTNLKQFPAKSQLNILKNLQDVLPTLDVTQLHKDDIDQMNDVFAKIMPHNQKPLGPYPSGKPGEPSVSDWFTHRYVALDTVKAQKMLRDVHEKWEAALKKAGMSVKPIQAPIPEPQKELDVNETFQGVLSLARKTTAQQQLMRIDDFKRLMRKYSHAQLTGWEDTEFLDRELYNVNYYTNMSASDRSYMTRPSDGAEYRIKSEKVKEEFNKMFKEFQRYKDSDYPLQQESVYRTLMKGVYNL